MDEEELERREPLRDITALRESYGRAEKQGKQGKKSRGFTTVVAMQMVVCAVLLLFVFAMMKSSTGSFAKLKAEFERLMGDTITAQDVSGWWEEVKSVMKAAPAQGESVDDLAQKPPESTDASVPNGAGGVDIDVDTGLKLPSGNTSFSPVYVTSPVTVPVNGRVTSPFGHRTHPITGKEGFHTGVDIAAPEGTRIAAAYYGKVSVVASDEGSGNYIVLDHGGGFTTVYCHCASILAQKGAVVRAGETIAYVGSTGMATGPHLHFEVRLNQVRHNPAWLLRGVLDGV